MLFRNRVEPGRNLVEGQVQVERAHADLISAHLVHTIRLHIFVGLSVEQHARNAMRLGGTGKLSFLVLHVGEYLIQVTRVDATLIESLLVVQVSRLLVVLRVDDEDGPASPERYVGVHGRKHVVEAVIERPTDIRRTGGKLGMLAPVILEDELLV